MEETKNKEELSKVEDFSRELEKYLNAKNGL